MYCELNTYDTPFEPLNNLHAYCAHAAFGVSTSAAVKKLFHFRWHFVYKKYANKDIENIKK